MAALLDVIAGLTARVDALEQADRTIKVEGLEELQAEKARLSETVIAASGVEASLRNQTVASQVEHDRQGVESRAALEAQAKAIDAFRSSVSSTTGLMSERSARVEDQVAVAESNLRRVEAGMAEVDGQVEAIGRPITRAEVNTMATDVVAEQWREQLPAMTEAVAQMMLDMYPGGVAGQRMDPELIRRQRSDAANYLDPVRGA